MLRARWMGVLALCLAVAGVFAWLGQWQLERAIDSNPPAADATEHVLPLTDVVEPAAYLPEPSVGQKVDVSGSFTASDFYVVSGRFNDGISGFWVTGQLRLTDVTPATSIAVAVGFTTDRAVADAQAAALSSAPPQNVDVTGRIISDEGAMAPTRSQGALEVPRMSTAALLNLWSDVPTNVYRPYMTSDTVFGDLEAIDSPAPDIAPPVNWLNLFYAAEWIVFAGFAFYFWYRLARDAWEKEVEEIEDANAAAEVTA